MVLIKHICFEFPDPTKTKVGKQKLPNHRFIPKKKRNTEYPKIINSKRYNWILRLTCYPTWCQMPVGPTVCGQRKRQYFMRCLCGFFILTGPTQFSNKQLKSWPTTRVSILKLTDTASLSSTCTLCYVGLYSLLLDSWFIATFSNLNLTWKKGIRTFRV